MGRTILADEQSQSYIFNLLKSGKWFIGLIIGQMTSQKDYAVRLIRTPEPSIDECSEDEGVDSTKRRKSKNKPNNLSDVDEHWSAIHAKQVIRMLPGGIDVIGTFAIAPPKMLQASQSKLRQVLYRIHKTQKKVIPILDQEGITDKILLQICSETQKVTCRTLDVSDPKSELRPADWKVQQFGDIWIKLQSQIKIDIQMHIPLSYQDQLFFKRIQGSILPFCKNILDCTVTFNNSLLNANDPVDPSQTEPKKGKGRDKSVLKNKSLNVDLLLKCGTETFKTPQAEECTSKMVIRGILSCCAFAHGKSTAGEASHAVKVDILRSLISRCELLSEDIDVVEEDASLKELYDTPVRVYGHLPASSIQFCDYMFQDEKIQEVVDRIKELLDIDVTEDQLDLARERVATEDDWLKAKHTKPTDSNDDVDVKTQGQGVNIQLGVVFGVLVMFFAIALYFLM